MDDVVRQRRYPVLLSVILAWAFTASQADTPAGPETFRSANGAFELRLNGPMTPDKIEDWSMVETATGRVMYHIHAYASGSVGLVTDDGQDVVLIESRVSQPVSTDRAVLRFYHRGTPGSTFTLEALEIPGGLVHLSESHYSWFMEGLPLGPFPEAVPKIVDGQLKLTAFDLRRLVFNVHDGTLTKVEPDPRLRKGRILVSGNLFFAPRAGDTGSQATFEFSVKCVLYGPGRTPRSLTLQAGEEAQMVPGLPTTWRQIPGSHAGAIGLIEDDRLLTAWLIGLPCDVSRADTR